MYYYVLFMNSLFQFKSHMVECSKQKCCIRCNQTRNVIFVFYNDFLGSSLMSRASWVARPQSLPLPLHVSSQLPAHARPLSAALIGGADRLSAVVISGAFPICNPTGSRGPFPALHWLQPESVSVPSHWAPSASPALCLPRPPSYWLLQAASTAAEKTPPWWATGLSRYLKKAWLFKKVFFISIFLKYRDGTARDFCASFGFRHRGPQGGSMPNFS